MKAFMYQTYNTLKTVKLRKVCLPSKYVNINDLLNTLQTKTKSWFSSKIGAVTITKAICFQDSRFVSFTFVFVYLNSGQILEVCLNNTQITSSLWLTSVFL